jgi:hypothetical protein
MCICMLSLHSDFVWTSVEHAYAMVYDFQSHTFHITQLISQSSQLIHR